MKIEGFSRYTFNKDGTIVSHTGKVLSYHRCKKGYCRVNLKDDLGRKKTYLVHRMVALANLPNPDDKPQVNHIDGVKENNSVENLEWCSNLENNRHASSMGLHKVGDKRPNSSLSDREVLEMRQLREQGWNYYQLGRKYNIAYQTAHKVCTYQTYRHL